MYYPFSEPDCQKAKAGYLECLERVDRSEKKGAAPEYGAPEGVARCREKVDFEKSGEPWNYFAENERAQRRRVLEVTGAC